MWRSPACRRAECRRARRVANSAAVSRLITTMLFGVQPLDFVTFALVTIVLGIMTAAAIAGPAWRAARIDPAQALRAK